MESNFNMQVLKEVYLPLFDQMDDCLDIAVFAIQNLSVTQNLMENPIYKTAFSVEEVNRLAAAGVPFRDAYKQVGMAIERGEFDFHGELNHTHEGSIGNLCNTKIAQRMNATLSKFPFAAVHDAIAKLLA